MTSTSGLGGLLSPAPGRRLSTVLRDLDAAGGARIRLGDLVGALRDRSFAPLMVVFAAPNVLLFVPGSSVVTGLPLIFLSVRLLLGRPDVWLPRFLSARSLEHATFSRIVSVALPYVERVERLARPRWWPRSYRLADGIIGCAALLMSVFMFLPIPFANTMPAISVIMLALALSERDGLWLLGGLTVAVVSIAIVVVMLSAGTFALLELFP